MMVSFNDIFITYTEHKMLHIRYNILNNILSNVIRIEINCDHLLSLDDFNYIIEPSKKELEEIIIWFCSLDNYFIELLKKYNNYGSLKYDNNYEYYDIHEILLEIWYDSGCRELNFVNRIVMTNELIIDHKNRLCKKFLVIKNIKLAINNNHTILGKIHEKYIARKILSNYLLKVIWDVRTRWGKIYFDIRLRRDNLENIFIE